MQKNKSKYTKKRYKKGQAQSAKKVSVKKVKEPKKPIELTPAKKRIFTLIALTIPVLFFVILEISLRIAEYGGNNRLFIPTPNPDSPTFGINQNVNHRYFYRDTFLPTPRKDLFLIKKPENGFRLFVLGGSTTAGFPFGNNLTFPRILNRRLADTFPKKRIEVINTAMTAINSYTLLDFMDEILEQQPDGLLIYAGHNEFYGALGVSSMESLGKSNGFVRLYLKLEKFKTFMLIRNSVGKLLNLLRGKQKEENVNDPMRTIMARIVKNKTIPLDGRLYKRGEKQFRNNMRSILKKAHKAGVPVIISELVSNIRDFPPFESVKTKDLPAAIDVYSSAQQLDKSREFDKARQEYYQAKNLDALRFRATEGFNDIIHQVADQFNVPVLPMKSIFEENSPNRLLGNNLMSEHLHPNIDGYFLMADAFYETIRKEDWIKEEWDTRYIAASSYYKQNWGLTKLDSVNARLIVEHLKGGWPFKKEGQPNTILYEIEPSGLEENIILDILLYGKKTLEQGHLEMAKYFYDKGDIESALREYSALIYTVPNLQLFYEPALSILVDTEQYQRALRLLFDGLKYQDSAFFYKWIGQIYLVNNMEDRGIAFLEKAKSMEPNDTQVLFNLCRAYYKTGQLSKGEQLYNQLVPKISNTAEFKTLQAFRDSVKQQQ